VKRRHRPNVAAILRRADGLLLIGQRSDHRDCWQFPQGGVDKGESPAEAVVREVEEEVGLPPGSYRVVEERGPYTYDFPGGVDRRGYHGQSQTYFLCDLREPGEPQIDLRKTCGEFIAVRWVAPSAFPLELVPAMKREVYRQVLADFFPSTGKRPV
jgi:putative (di)nucleoside polyphosphate hydrolase